MKKHTIVAAAFSTTGEEATNAVIWVTDKRKLVTACEALKTLQATLPDLVELSFRAPGIGVDAAFGDVDTEDFGAAEGAEAVETLDADLWVELQDPEAPIEAAFKKLGHEPDSLRIRLKEDGFYVTAVMGDTLIESAQIPI